MNLLHPFATHLPLVGVDISGPVVRAVQFDHLGRMARKVLAVGEVELSQAAAADPFASSKETAGAVKKVLEEPEFGRFGAKVAMASLPEHRCFARVIHVQAGMSDSEVGQAVPFEAESYIPVPLDQVYLDWQRIKGSDERTAVLLVAAPKDVVERAIEIISGTGLEVAGLEVESMSLARGSLGVNSGEDCLVVDIGTNRTDLVVVEQGSLQFASSIPVAESNFVEAAVKGLGLSRSQAAKIVRKAGIENTPAYPNLRQVLGGAVDMLAAEIKNIINFHDQHSPRRFVKIILVGRGAGLLNLDSALKEVLPGLPGVEIGDPWRVAKVGDAPKNFSGLSGVRFTAAVGLALREAVEI